MLPSMKCSMSAVCSFRFALLPAHKVRETWKPFLAPQDFSRVACTRASQIPEWYTIPHSCKSPFSRTETVHDLGALASLLFEAGPKSQSHAIHAAKAILRSRANCPQFNSVTTTVMDPWWTQTSCCLTSRQRVTIVAGTSVAQSIASGTEAAQPHKKCQQQQLANQPKRGIFNIPNLLVYP